MRITAVTGALLLLQLLCFQALFAQNPVSYGNGDQVRVLTMDRSIPELPMRGCSRWLLSREVCRRNETWDEVGSKTSDSFTVGKDGEKQPPTASFTNNCTTLKCVFDNSEPFDTHGSIVSYNWDFVDGSVGSAPALVLASALG